jgi:hypothetical protein
MLKELGKIFGSESRVKILRYFLAHPDEQIEVDDLSKKAKVKNPDLKKDIRNLVAINFLNELTLVEEVEINKKNGKSGKSVQMKSPQVKQIKKDGLELNKNYVFVDSLANLLLDFRYIDRKELLEDFKRYGKIKLLCLGGVFLQDEEGKLDLLLVGDALDKDKIDDFIEKLEADFGTEMRYAVFESEEFRYRVNMFDRLIKDFFKGPHEKILEKIDTRP